MFAGPSWIMVIRVCRPAPTSSVGSLSTVRVRRSCCVLSAAGGAPAGQGKSQIASGVTRQSLFAADASRRLRLAEVHHLLHVRIGAKASNSLYGAVYPCLQAAPRRVLERRVAAVAFHANDSTTMASSKTAATVILSNKLRQKSG